MTQLTIVNNLQNKTLYDFPIAEFKLLETHISWVILTGKYAYKIKKAVDFEFLNYSTLEKRKYFCKKELDLNKQLAPQIYLEVLPITGTPEAPQFKGTGPVIEYCLKMREFPQEMMFNHLLEKQRLTSAHIEETARILADFHKRTNHNSPESLGTVTQVHEPVKQNFDQIRPLLSNAKEIIRIDKLESWADAQHQQWHDVFVARKSDGFIRACHGDIHLGNITLFENKPVIFDCVEFNEPFRWTDTMADLGFLVMDLHDHGQYGLANRLINTYLENSCDYSGTQVLRYYTAYRALVRAKITLFDLSYSNNNEAKKLALKKQYDKLIALAESYTKTKPAHLLIMHGLAGSGKSTIARALAAKTGAIQIRSDVIRKQIAGLAPYAKTDSKLNKGLYDPAATEQTYAKLAELAALVIQAGFSVIIDAAFLKQRQRRSFFTLAETLQIPIIILDCQAPMKTLVNWVEKREQRNHDASEAGVEVLKMQHETEQPLAEEEKKHSIIINTADKMNVDSIIAQLQM